MNDYRNPPFLLKHKITQKSSQKKNSGRELKSQMPFQ